MSDISSSVGQSGTNFNPFPGLRPFSQEESNLFFGREGQSRSVLESLERNRFVAVIGASGSGKSSLIYCGVLPELQKHTSKNWVTVTTRPGSNPLQNLLDSFSDAYPGKFNVGDIEDLLSQKAQLPEWIKKKKLGDQPILIIVDQFEEIFRFTGVGADENKKENIQKFVDLIYSAANSETVPLNVVLTMRSDFIGECAVFQNLTELINRSNYLIPQMTRDDFKNAIVGPVGIGGASIDDDLVEQLLNEVGNNNDQLPVLQHSLMRTWEYWKLQNDPDKPISIEDYEAIGRMEKALSDHANEAYDELKEEQRIICENIFKTLTEKGGDNRGVRRPNVVKQIAAISKCTVEEIVEIAELFRTKGRTFLTPYQPVEITEDTVIDISHESLMRIWDRLRLWVDEEAGSVDMYYRLSEASELYQEGRTGLWRPPDLQLALNWRNKQQPTATWGVQYHPAFERAMVYLETSDSEFKKEEENKIRLQKRRLKITRSFAMILGAIAVFAMGLFLWTRDLKSQAELSAADAYEQTLIADANADTANIQRALAIEAAERALIQQELAEEAQVEADSSAKEALRAKDIADAERERAIRGEREAAKQARIAKENEEFANAQTALAVEQSNLAAQRRMLSIAKSMAVKSLNIADDPDLKSLLAYQAYQYNAQYNGPVHEADIYAGLYSARKTLLGDQYNVYGGHTQSVEELVFHPNMNSFYTAGTDGQVLKWALSDTSKSFEIITETPLLLKSLAISADGSKLAVGSDMNGIMIYNTNNPEEAPLALMGHNGRIRGIEFSSTGEMFSIGLDKQILKWNISSKTSEVFASSEYRYNDIDVSKDSQLIGACDRSGNIYIISKIDPEEPMIIPGTSSNPVFSLAFSSDGKYLAAGDQKNNVRIYSTDTWKEINTLRGNKARVVDVRFSPNSSFLASTGNDGQVLMWEMEDLNNSPFVMEDNEGRALTVDFSPDEKVLVSGSSQGSRLIARPVRSIVLIEEFCSLIKRNFTREEWEVYIGSDIEFIETCPLLVTEK